MCFDVPKVVRSSGCEHGHDKESQNGRDMKIDILDDYVWTPKWFQMSSGIYQSTGRLPETPGGQWALVEIEGSKEVWGAPPPQDQTDFFRALGAGPLFPSPLLLFPSPPSWTRKGGTYS